MNIMETLLKQSSSLLKFILFFSFAVLAACDNQSDNSQYAFLTATVEGTDNSAATKTIINRQGKNHLPPDVTRIDFNITDSEGINTTASLAVGPETTTLNIRVFANRNLVIRVDVYAGDTLAFQGQDNVAALRPGQAFPLSIEADPVGGTPPPPATPTLDLDQNAVSVFEGDDFTATSMTFTVNLSALANGDVTVDFTVTDGTATRNDGDYTTTTGTATISAGNLTTTFDIVITGDTTVEPDESFNITLSNISPNAILGVATTIGTIISDDFPGRLNDTGITLCADVGSTDNLDCAATGATATVDGTDPADNDIVPAGQDAHFGRDAVLNDPTDGAAGFSFTKLDANGNPLADQTQPYFTQPWPCVQDNYTGLIWEVKTTDQGLQNNANGYTWFNSTGINDGGSPGLADPGTSLGCTDTGNCDTEKFTAEVNALGLCNLADWRLPTVEELLSIIDNSQLFPQNNPNAGYFPNEPQTEGPAETWTSASLADSPNTGISSNAAWTVANDGTITFRSKNFQNFVRLVSDGIVPAAPPVNVSSQP